MGTCYTYLLHDNFDWSYQSKTKEEVIEQLKDKYKYADVVAQWPHYIVIDLDKRSPWSDTAQSLKYYCESAHYYTDSSEWDIKPVEFKKTEEDKIIEAAEPANRNAKHIAEARAEWDKRHWQASQNK